MRQKCREGRRELIRLVPHTPAAGRASQAWSTGVTEASAPWPEDAETPGHTCWVFRTTLEQEVHMHMEDEQLSKETYKVHLLQLAVWLLLLE